jgi:hypothetical protein
MKNKMLLVCLALIGIWCFSGCARVPMASKEADLAAKEFKAPTNGKAGVYIYRNEIMGAAIRMRLAIDEQPLGRTAKKTYHYVELTPGNHTIKGTAENDSVLDVNLSANKLHYIWQEVKMGFLYARNKLQLVDEEKGQKGVLESKLALPDQTVHSNQ